MAATEHVTGDGTTGKPLHRGHIGLIVALSMAAGLLLALVFAVLVVGGGTEPVVTGLVLLAFSVGWVMLAWLSTRRTEQPQRWAYVPAVVMAALGVTHLVLRPSDDVLTAFGWVWPVPLAVLVVWMVWQSRLTLRSWSRPVILYPVFAVLLLAAAGGVYQAIGSTTSYAMPGELVDVGGYKLHISCTGTGSPTVVLEGGLGEPAVMMAGWIQPAVAGTTKVCVYDRAGKGFSDPAPELQDGIAAAAALHTLLANAHIPGPYVLAGHSSGGPYIKVFAQQYPDQVAGMVLLDAQPSDVFAKLPGYPTIYSVFRKGTGILPSLSRLGIVRLASTRGEAGLPPEARAEERSDWSTAAHYRSLRDELLELKT
ncbi:MAG: alpha/beta hydrolase, partial [Nocardioidaceae bacterium]